MIYRVYYHSKSDPLDETYKEFHFLSSANYFAKYLEGLDDIGSVRIFELDGIVDETLDLTSICPKTGVTYVRLSNVPENERKPLDLWLTGQARPIIEGLDVQDALFSWDYRRWKKSLIK